MNSKYNFEIIEKISYNIYNNKYIITIYGNLVK